MSLKKKQQSHSKEDQKVIQPQKSVPLPHELLSYVCGLLLCCEPAASRTKWMLFPLPNAFSTNKQPCPSGNGLASFRVGWE